MEQVVCKKCGLINNYRIEHKANNNCAYCNGCGSFIKNIAYREPALYVGKYKCVPIKEIEDMGYLKWALRELRVGESVRTAIERRISEFENLAR